MQLELKLFAKQEKINLYWFLKTLPHTHTPLKIKIKKIKLITYGHSLQEQAAIKTHNHTIPNSSSSCIYISLIISYAIPGVINLITLCYNWSYKHKNS